MRLVFLFMVLIVGGYVSAQVETKTTSDTIRQEDNLMKKDVEAPMESLEEEESVPTRNRNQKKKAAQAKMVMKSEVSAQPPVPAAEMQQKSLEFNATRGNASNQRTQRTPTPEQQKEMDDAVRYFEQNAPDAFEYHYFKYMSGNYDLDLVGHLEKAESIKPNNSDVHVQMAAVSIIKNNIAEALRYMNRLVESERLSASVLQYSEDVLLSAPDSSVLITHGFDDTYGTWYQQNANGVRKDVSLVSLDFLQSEDYREQIKNKGVNVPTRETVDVAFLEEFVDQNQDETVCISMTTPKEYLVPLKDNLYVNGLVLQYSKDAIENMESNEVLWNSTLSKHLVNEAKDDKARSLSSNYLPMLFTLRQYYILQNNNKMVVQIDTVINHLAIQSGKKEQAKKLLKAY